MTLDLQPAVDHRYTFDLQGEASIPVYLLDDGSQQPILTHFRAIEITLDHSNSFQLCYEWADQATWDVTVPAKPRPAAVIRRDAMSIGTAEFHFFRTWRVSSKLFPAEPLLLKLGLLHDRLVTHSGRQLAASRSLPWAVRIPIELSGAVYAQLGGLVAATYLLAVAYRHQIDGD